MLFSCLRVKQCAAGDSASIRSLESGMKINPANERVKNLIAQLTDEFYGLARKKWWRKACGGTVIVNHLREETTDWHETKQTFISPPIPFNRPYKPGVLKKIFKSKGPEHDGAVIFYLHDGLIDSVLTKLPVTNHNCEQCANRGTRHTSACSFSNYTPMPIIVISEEKSQVSLFWRGRAQFNIGKEILKEELLKAYETQEQSCLAYTTFDSQYFSKSFHLDPYIPNNDNYKWYFDIYRMTYKDLHKGIATFPYKRIFAFQHSISVIDGVLCDSELYNEAENHIAKTARTVLNSYNDNKEQCLILSHGDKRLGGLFYNVMGNTIRIGNIFILRQLLHNNFVARLISEVLWKKLFPQCCKIEFTVPEYLKESFANMIEALNNKNGPSLCVKTDTTMTELLCSGNVYLL